MLLPGQNPEPSIKPSEKDNRVIDLLSDTQGFNLKPYLNRLIERVRTNWFELIPESAQMKKGRVSIRLRVMKDGRITDVKYDVNSGDVTLDRAAYGAVVASNPLRPFPSEFACQYIDLRFNFYYNPGPADVAEKNVNDQVVPCVTSKIEFIRTLAITVSPSSAQVATGSKQQFHATITDAVDSAVTWSVGGRGCEGSACGTISADGLYTAPAKVPNPATISVTAAAAISPTESASSTVTIVQAADSR